MVQDKSSSNKYEIDMCNGPLFGKIILYSVPLMLSGILQLLFNAADIVVVGRFAGNHALAAVGATSSLINLLVNLFMGLSVGANVLVARFYGGGQKKEISETVHTAVLTAVIGGVLLLSGLFSIPPPAYSHGDAGRCVIAFRVIYENIFCRYAGHAAL